MSAAFAAKVAVARAAGALSRASGRGGGTNLPGKVLLRLDDRALARLAGRVPGDTTVVSATNGKTTTSAMIAGVLERTGARLVHNRAGANMATGIVSTLLGAVRRGRVDGDRALWEVDEFWLDRVVGDLDPEVLLLANLFRDQLDRYGELEAIADRWAAVVAARAGRTRFVLNADDPLVADLGRIAGAHVRFFGVEDTRLAAGELEHASDSKHCRNCGAPYAYDLVLLAHLGHFHCERCGQRRPAPQVVAERVDLHGTESATVALRAPEGTATVELPLPGLYNVYNALGAAAVCLELGVPLPDVAAGLEAVEPAFGRSEVIRAGTRRMRILLVKNPAGANEVARTLALEPGELDLLMVLNDRIADGRDVSWIWDADLERLAGGVRRVTCAGTRAAELALRLRYAGIPTARLHVVPRLETALDDALADGEGVLHAVPTYTALLELKALVADRGWAPDFWAARG